LLEDGLTNGEWADAERALAALRCCRTDDDEEPYWVALSRPDSVLTRAVVRRLDGQAQPEVAQFLSLAQQVGAGGLDWLIRIMAESQQQRVRRPLARTLAQVVDGRLDRLTHWLDDPRWYVVRNLVTVLHAIGGAAIVPALRRVVSHPERRVRLEVIAALGTAPPAEARALLLPMLGTDDARELSGALRLLAQGPDPELSQQLFTRLLADGFHQRPVEEQRAVLSALAVTADDDAVPLLETCLDPAKRPSAEAETLLQGVARCLARMGTPAARAALQRAMGSHWNMTRDAASMALTSMRPK
jgi:HEAT repeat protein